VSDERLEAVIASVPALAGRVRATEEITGGLINRSVKVATTDASYVVRLFTTHSELLLIDRDNEAGNSELAARSGVGAGVIAYLPEHQAMVLEFIEGVPQSDIDLCRGEKPRMVARTLRELHSGPAFGRDFDMFDVQRRYLAIVDAQGFRIPDRYPLYLPHAARMEAAIRATDHGKRPCHNDLMPGNFIDVGGRLRLIDYEYSGNNDPCFDLGGIWAEAGMSLAQLETMVAEYYGEPRPDRVARARLWAVMWSYGWTLWAAIQVGEGMQYEDFDAWTWAEAHLDRVETMLGGSELDHLLAELGA